MPRSTSHQPAATRPTTLKDIAAQVGVSNMTVSAVLGSHPSRHVRVSEATRERVIAAAQRMQYRPNRAAQALRGQQTNVIGVYASVGHLDPQVVFTAQIIGGLHRGCDARQKDLLLHGTYRARSADDVLAQLTCGSVDGLVVYSSPQDPVVARLAESRIPVVAIVDALPGVASVVADDAQGARLLAAHIAHRAPQRPVVFRGDALGLASARRRQEAFVTAATARGLTVTISTPATVTYHDRFAPSEVDALLSGAWAEGAGGQRGNGGGPATVVCWNDATAWDLLEHCRLRGVRVPEDIAVVGFDDVPSPHSLPWRLTTIRAPWVEVAQTAIDRLIDQIESIDGAENAAAETVLPVTLVSGDTV